MELNVYKSDGTQPDAKAFEVPELEEGKGVQALRDVIIALQANRRQGNACTKTRSEVSGTGKKAYRQKGTGNARHGDRQSPIYVGGGIAHGPRPRDYSKQVNRKVKRLAMNRALCDCIAEGRLHLIQSFDQEAPKTKAFQHILTNMGLTGKMLISDDGFAEATLLSARNIEGVTLREAAELNPLDLLKAHHMLLTETALHQLINRIARKEAHHAAA